MVALAVHAAPCPEEQRGTLEEWKCFGQVEFAARTEGQPDFGARFVFFDGRERLYEKRDAEGVTLGDVRRGWQGPCD